MQHIYIQESDMIVTRQGNDHHMENMSVWSHILWTGAHSFLDISASLVNIFKTQIHGLDHLLVTYFEVCKNGSNITVALQSVVNIIV